MSCRRLFLAFFVIVDCNHLQNTLLLTLSALVLADNRFLPLPSDPQTDASLVRTENGWVKGWMPADKSYRRFEGVPFAKPPLGELRWRWPQRATDWPANVSINCTSFDIGCAQNAHSLDVPKNTSEDCLYTEVWTPPRSSTKKFPVMVWFYGGDFKEGGESFGIYNGRHLASTADTVVVVGNYRVGNLGFLYTGVTDANVGIADQRFILEWVQRNIAAFGGDSSRVTIFGQSAGGQSVLIHLASPEAPTAHAFHRAIIESGPVVLSYKQPEYALVLAFEFAYKLGCDLSDIKCMQSKSTKEVLKAAGGDFVVPFDVGEAVQQWAPVVTFDKYLPMQPIDAFRKGLLVTDPKPTIVSGSTYDDAALFAYALSNDAPLVGAEYVGIVFLLFHFKTEAVETVLQMYPASDVDNRPVLSRLLTDFMFTCAARRVLSWTSDYGYDSYWYRFDRVPPFCFWPKHQAYCCELCCHGTEIPFVYYDSGAPFPWTFNAIDERLANQTSMYWSNVAHSGDPNKPMQPHVSWPPYSDANQLAVTLNATIEQVQGLQKETCDAFDKIGYDEVSLDYALFTKLAAHLKKMRSSPQ